MVDTFNRYIGGGPKHLSRKEIEKMRKNMKKVPVIQLQSEIYHEKEAEKAEEILEYIDEVDQVDSNKIVRQSSHQKKIPYRKKILHRLRQLFISRS